MVNPLEEKCSIKVTKLATKVPSIPRLVSFYILKRALTLKNIFGRAFIKIVSRIVMDFSESSFAFRLIRARMLAKFLGI